VSNVVRNAFHGRGILVQRLYITFSCERREFLAWKRVGEERRVSTLQDRKPIDACAKKTSWG